MHPPAIWPQGFPTAGRGNSPTSGPKSAYHATARDVRSDAPLAKAAPTGNISSTTVRRRRFQLKGAGGGNPWLY